MQSDDNIQGGEAVKPESQEKVLHLATQIIEPALQKALAEASAEATPQEVVSALANCYANLLVDLVGRKGAAALLQNHAYHIVSREEAIITN